MKKVLFIALAVAAISFASCGNKTQQGTDADTAAVVEENDLTAALKAALENKDAASLQAAIEALQAKIAELTKEGKLDEAKEALTSVQTWLKENQETVKSVTGDNATLNTLVEKVQAIPTESVDAIKSFGTQTEEAAAAAVENTKEAVNAKANEAVEKANEAVDNAKQQAKDKAKEEVNKAADKALNKLGL
ncbi:MAG: hypothetical protein IJ549_00385 [Prevotella sp.]|nr:hypothetical protein [Prevotella sp.]MBQ8701207.1 hypothetical protein [Prevotella sp.]